MKRSGFTIVELIITIAAIGVLLTLAVVNLNDTQVNARDAERQGDVEAIALQLEKYYANEDSASSGAYDMSGGSYPAVINISDETAFKTALPDIEPKLVRAPGVEINDPKSLIPAANTATSPTAVTPQPTYSTYVYQPLRKDGTLCTQILQKGDCRRFNLFYRLESDNTVRVITSKHQA